MKTLLQSLAINLPIIQAPMAGVSTPAMAAAVSNAGGLGSLGVGNLDAQGAGQGAPLARCLPAAELIAELRFEMEEATVQPLVSSLNFGVD